MFGLACSKFGLKISGTCLRRSKFDSPKFEEFEVRFFDVRSKTTLFLFNFPNQNIEGDSMIKCPR